MKRMLWIALLLVPLPVTAEQIVMQDGTVVHGELVDFQNGVYTVKVGKFVKTIPESRIADVRPDAPTTSTPAATAPIAPPVTGPMGAGHKGGAAGGGAGNGAAVPPIGFAGSPLGGSLGGAAGGPGSIPGLGAGGRGAPPSVDEVLKRVRGDPTISNAVQKLMSGGGLDGSSMQELQNNPAMEKLVERFRDPAYQKQLLDGLGEMDRAHPGQRNPMLDQLQGLFNQLNTLHGQQPTAPQPPPAPGGEEQ